MVTAATNIGMMIMPAKTTNELELLLSSAAQLGQAWHTDVKKIMDVTMMNVICVLRLKVFHPRTCLIAKYLLQLIREHKAPERAPNI
jgi:hypothetical protein